MHIKSTRREVPLVRLLVIMRAWWQRAAWKPTTGSTTLLALDDQRSAGLERAPWDDKRQLLDRLQNVRRCGTVKHPHVIRQSLIEYCRKPIRKQPDRCNTAVVYQKHQMTVDVHDRRKYQLVADAASRAY